MTATTLPAFLTSIAGRTAHLGIIGLGYVGLPLTLLCSKERFGVTAIATFRRPRFALLHRF